MVRWRSLKQPARQSTEIQSRPANDKHPFAVLPGVIDGLSCLGTKTSTIELFVGVDDINQVMRNSCPLLWSGLCGAYVEIAIHLARVSTDNFCPVASGKFNRERSFPGRRRPG